jgi:hypothetical protein
VSYSPSVSYEPLNSDFAHLVLYADSDKDRRAELASAFDEVFQQFKDLEEVEIESARNQLLEYRIGSLAPPPEVQKFMKVQRAAMDWILGNEYEPWESSVSQLNSVTIEDVSSIVRSILANAIFALPKGARLSPGFGTRAPISTATAVQGRRVKHLDSPIRREVLVYGPEGVSLLWQDGSHYTVRFSELAAVLYYKDGALQLIGSDAASIVVEPTLWRSGQGICNEILKQVPAQLRIDQGSRPADSIPVPTTTAWQRFRAETKGLPYWVWIIIANCIWIIFSLILSIISHNMK